MGKSGKENAGVGNAIRDSRILGKPHIDSESSSVVSDEKRGGGKVPCRHSGGGARDPSQVIPSGDRDIGEPGELVSGGIVQLDESTKPSSLAVGEREAGVSSAASHGEVELNAPDEVGLFEKISSSSERIREMEGLMVDLTALQFDPPSAVMSRLSESVKRRYAFPRVELVFPALQEVPPVREGGLEALEGGRQSLQKSLGILTESGNDLNGMAIETAPAESGLLPESKLAYEAGQDEFNRRKQEYHRLLLEAKSAFEGTRDNKSSLALHRGLTGERYNNLSRLLTAVPERHDRLSLKLVGEIFKNLSDSENPCYGLFTTPAVRELVPDSRSQFFEILSDLFQGAAALMRCGQHYIRALEAEQKAHAEAFGRVRNQSVDMRTSQLNATRVVQGHLSQIHMCFEELHVDQKAYEEAFRVLSENQRKQKQALADARQLVQNKQAETDELLGAYTNLQQDTAELLKQSQRHSELLRVSREIGEITTRSMLNTERGEASIRALEAEVARLRQANDDEKRARERLEDKMDRKIEEKILYMMAKMTSFRHQLENQHLCEVDRRQGRRPDTSPSRSAGAVGYFSGRSRPSSDELSRYDERESDVAASSKQTEPARHQRRTERQGGSYHVGKKGG